MILVIWLYSYLNNYIHYDFTNHQEWAFEIAKEVTGFGICCTFDKFIIAPGSTTNIPEIPGLKEAGYLTNVILFELEEKPESIRVHLNMLSMQGI